MFTLLNYRMFFAAILAMVFCSCSQPHLKEQNPLGIIFECKKAEEVEVPEVGSVAVTGFQVQNVVPGQWFYLKREDYFGNLHSLYTFFSDENGRLLAVKNKKIITALDLLRLFETNALPGKRSKYWLVSQDGATIIMSSYIPYAIRTVANDGASLSLESIYDNSNVAIQAEGFHPNEPLKTRSRSGEECIEQQCVCDPRGKILVLIDPRVIGKKAGTATFEVIRQSGEVLKISYEWGPGVLSKEKIIAPWSKIPSDVVKKLFQEK
jgi:hypothetical protein